MPCTHALSQAHLHGASFLPAGGGWEPPSLKDPHSSGTRDEDWPLTFCWPPLPNPSRTAAISYGFTYMLCGMVWGTFLFFAGLTLLLAFWSWYFMPETHHVPLERVPDVLAGD